MGIAKLFVVEAGGGILWGGALGAAGYFLLRSIDNYQVEVLITLALVTGGYRAASGMHISGPLAMVVAGLMIGNHGRLLAMSDTTRLHLDKFWELIDEILNAVLFLLIGLELFVLKLSGPAITAGLVAIIIGLGARFLAVWLPVTLLKRKRTFSPGRHPSADLGWHSRRHLGCPRPRPPQGLRLPRTLPRDDLCRRHFLYLGARPDPRPLVRKLVTSRTPPSPESDPSS